MALRQTGNSLDRDNGVLYPPPRKWARREHSLGAFWWCPNARTDLSASQNPEIVALGWLHRQAEIYPLYYLAA
jgi:hypothetical protein